MANQHKVKVSFYWGGEVLNDGNSVRYSLPPKSNSNVPISISYERFVSILYNKMNINPLEESISIFGRYPYSSTSQGMPLYSEWNIYDVETLREFLTLPEAMKDQMSIRLLEIYIRTGTPEVNEGTYETRNVEPHGLSQFTQSQGNMLSERPVSQFEQNYGLSQLNHSYDASRGYEQTNYDGISQQPDFFGGCYRPEMFQSGPLRENNISRIVHLSTHHDWGCQEEDDPIFTELNERVTNDDVADAASEGSDSDIPNDADDSGEETSFLGDESEEERPSDVISAGNTNYHANHSLMA